MKKILIGCTILALAISCNKKEIEVNDSLDKTTSTDNRGRIDIIDIGGGGGDFDDPYFKLYGDIGVEKVDKFSGLYAAHTKSRTQVFDINPAVTNTITGDQGTQLLLGAFNFIDDRGRVVTGDVQIELIEVFSKSDMVMLDRATNGITEDGTAVNALGSGGEIFVRASQGATELDIISPIQVIVSDPDADPEMIKFTGIEFTGNNILWEAAEDERMDIEFGVGEGAGLTYEYDILPGQWGWTNIDRWYSNPCAKTTLFVDVPSGYDNTNTEVYLSYDGNAGRLANFDTWDGTMFTEHYGQICIGLECHFIAVSVVGGSLEYAIQGATIVDGHIEVISSFTPISEEDLIDEINGLP